MKIIQVVNDIHSWIVEQDIPLEEYAIFIKKESEHSTSGEIFLCSEYGRFYLSDLAEEYKVFFKDVHLFKNRHTLRIKGLHGVHEEVFSIKIKTAGFKSEQFKRLNRDSDWVNVLEDEDEYYW